MKKTMIFYVAGHSGGHIIPALTHAKQQTEMNPDISIGFFSTNASLDVSIIKQSPVKIMHVPLALSKMRIKQVYKYPLFVYQAIRLIMQSASVLRTHKASMVMSMGGYISIPVCIAAWVLRIPIELYELNVEPGRAVKLLARMARTVHICFPQTQQFLSVPTQLANYPVRFAQDQLLERTHALSYLGLDADKKTLLILGGSQGSQWLNGQIRLWVEQLPAAERLAIQIIHQTGANSEVAVRDFYAAQGVAALIFSYRDDIHSCYSAADTVISRAGAGALHELLFFKKKSVIIPLEASSTAHQVANADTFARNHPQQFIVMRQAAINHDFDLFCLHVSTLLQAA